MPILLLLANFGAGLFLCNAIPHLASGLRGESFPTPFAKPPGQGLSSAPTNTVWGTLNLAIGCLLLHVSPFEFGFNLPALLFFGGFLGIGIPMSAHFAKVRNR